jgi:hypothetical protein
MALGKGNIDILFRIRYNPNVQLAFLTSNSEGKKMPSSTVLITLISSIIGAILGMIIISMMPRWKGRSLSAKTIVVVATGICVGVIIMMITQEIYPNKGGSALTLLDECNAGVDMLLDDSGNIYIVDPLTVKVLKNAKMEPGYYSLNGYWYRVYMPKPMTILGGRRRNGEAIIVLTEEDLWRDGKDPIIARVKETIPDEVFMTPRKFLWYPATVGMTGSSVQERIEAGRAMRDMR